MDFLLTFFIDLAFEICLIKDMRFYGFITGIVTCRYPFVNHYNFITKSDWNVSIGTTEPQGKLDVNGAIYQRGSQLHADYVFEPDYQLETIKEHAEFMWQNKHLSAIPQSSMDEEGREFVELGTHRKGIVEELEKAHIYIEQLHTKINAMEESIKIMEANYEKMEEKFAKLAAEFSQNN
jgi:hypothetical protein